MRDRFLGALLGLACGDAVGTTVEFKPRLTFEPVTDMAGGGPFHLKPGEWTDDTSMALCLATSLVEIGGFDPADQMDRYTRWMREGYLSSNGKCFDVGLTVSRALNQYRQTGNPFSGPTTADTAGNGCLMRLAPVPMFFFSDRETAIAYSGESSRTTHGASECVEASRLLGAMIHLALAGQSKHNILHAHGQSNFTSPGITAIACGEYSPKSKDDICGSGYVVESLEAALWCFHCTDSFEGAILAAANLGSDADTTAAICGQVAGAFYGVQGIPDAWLKKLVMASEISQLAHIIYHKVAEARYQEYMARNRDAVRQAVVAIGHLGDLSKLPDSSPYRDEAFANRFINGERHTIREFAMELSHDECFCFLKGIALLEERDGFRGSATNLWPLLEWSDTPDRTCLKWVLENTTAYGYYAYGARSLEQLDEIKRRRTAIAAEGIRRDQVRQQHDKERIARTASGNLYNAVRRGDLEAVRGLLAKGADPSAPSHDGFNLVDFAQARGHEQIADKLRDATRRLLSNAHNSESPPKQS